MFPSNCDFGYLRAPVACYSAISVNSLPPAPITEIALSRMTCDPGNTIQQSIHTRQVCIRATGVVLCGQDAQIFHGYELKWGL